MQKTQCWQSQLKNDETPMTTDQSNPNTQVQTRVSARPTFDLEERTARFSEQIIDFCKQLPESTITRPLISQLVRSATSVSANYCEADEASSKRDFVNKISIVTKETKETKHWLRLISHTIPGVKRQSRILWGEAQELNLIFAAIIRSAKKKS